MKMDWAKYQGKTLNVTMLENYGVVYNKVQNDHPAFYEIVFKTGKLIESNEDGLVLETKREETTFIIFIPYNSIKCVEIY